MMLFSSFHRLILGHQFKVSILNMFDEKRKRTKKPPSAYTNDDFSKGVYEKDYSNFELRDFSLA